MKIGTAIFLLLGMLITFVLNCTNPVYDNVLDKKGINYAGDEKAADDDKDGLANLYDPDSKFYIQTDFHKPTLKLIGPETLVIARNDPKGLYASLKLPAGCKATDNSDGDISSKIVQHGTVFTSQCSSFKVIYTVSDLAGNSDTVSRIIIVDCNGPTITLNGPNPLILDQGQRYIEQGAKATDDIEGEVSVKISGKVNETIAGVDTITYYATDSVGNQSSEIRIVMKMEGQQGQDKTPPQITLKGSKVIRIKVGENYVEAGASAIDETDGDISERIVISGKVNTSVAGTDTVRYTVADRAGNKASEIRLVIKETSSQQPGTPLITLLGDNPMIVQKDSPFVDPGCIATDNIDGDISGQIVRSGTVNTAVAGKYILTYTVKNSAGLQASITRTVEVVLAEVDTVAPVITIEGCTICTVAVNSTYQDLGVSAYDNIDKNITNKIKRTVRDSSSKIVSINNFTTAVGKYTITYEVSDAAGNNAKAVIRTVIVVPSSPNIPPASGDTIVLVSNKTVAGENGKIYVINKIGDQYWKPEKLTLQISNEEGTISGSITINGQLYQLTTPYNNEFRIANDHTVVTTNISGKFKIGFHP